MQSAVILTHKPPLSNPCALDGFTGSQLLALVDSAENTWVSHNWIWPNRSHIFLFFFSTPRIFRQLKWVGAALIIMRIPVAGSNAVTRFLLQERACVISRVDLLWHSNMFHARSNLLSSAYFLRTDIHVTTPQEHLMEVGGNKRPFSSQPRPIISWPSVLSKLSCCPLPPEPLTLAVWMKKAQREGWQKRRQSLSTTGIQCCPLMVILSNYGFANYSRQTAAHTRTLPHHPF